MGRPSTNLTKALLALNFGELLLEKLFTSTAE